MPSRLHTTRFFSMTALALAAAGPSAFAAPPAARAFTFHDADVLGTALNLTVVAAGQKDADEAIHAATQEIARLKKTLSAYDADGEVARLNASPVNGPGVAVSPELIDVLKRYDALAVKTGGAYTGHAGGILAVWERAEKDGKPPADADLLAAAKRNKLAAWAIDEAAGTVRRIADQQINVDSLGKGYVIDKAMAAAVAAGGRAVRGVSLDLGGDLRFWGTPPDGGLWPVGVADPAHPQQNAKPLATIRVGPGVSVSSSGAYERFYAIDGQRYSHVIDARTGKPGRNVAATVVAADSATANALATICCAMRFGEAMQLVRSVPGAECLIVTADGKVLRSDGFKELEDEKLAAERFAPRAPSPFPAGFTLAVDFEVVPQQHRPYVFVWVTDAAGKYVKTLAAYGNERRWLEEMHEWWKFAAADKKLLATTKATQAANTYAVAWDGTNQKGGGVPAGAYKIWVEVSAEHGPYSVKFANVDIGKEPKSATIAKSSAFNAVAVRYGPGTK